MRPLKTLLFGSLAASLLFAESASAAPYLDLMKEEALVGSQSFSFTIEPAVEPGKALFSRYL